MGKRGKGKTERGGTRSVDEYLSKHASGRRTQTESPVGGGLERERCERADHVERDDYYRSRGMEPESANPERCRPGEDCVEGVPVILSHGLTALALSFSLFVLLSNAVGDMESAGAPQEYVDGLQGLASTPYVSVLVSAGAFVAVFSLLTFYYVFRKADRKRTRGEFMRSVLIATIMLACASAVAYSSR